jgi:RNA polymerase-interacting CarD/CdnL/TRCF family regulator
MDWWVWVIIGFVVIGLLGNSEQEQQGQRNNMNSQNQNRGGINTGDVLDVASVVVDDDEDDFDLFG